MDALRAFRAEHALALPDANAARAADALAIVAKVVADTAALRKLAAVDNRLACECMPAVRAADRLWAAYTARLRATETHGVLFLVISRGFRVRIDASLWVALPMAVLNGLALYGVLTGRPNLATAWFEWSKSLPWNRALERVTMFRSGDAAKLATALAIHLLNAAAHVRRTVRTTTSVFSRFMSPESVR